MNPRRLESNEQLLEYLVWLGGELKAKNAPELANVVEMATRFSGGSASEFLHEAHRALSSVRSTGGFCLGPAQIADLTSVVDQIQDAFTKIGGA